jgi:hypothetical protein
MRGRGVVRRFDPGSVTRGTACLTSVCLQAVLKAAIYGQGRRSSRSRSSATKALKAALRSYGYRGWDRQRNRRVFSGMIRRVSTPREGSKILTFLFRPRPVCSSLLHL